MTLAIVLLVPDIEVVIPEMEVRDRIDDALPIVSGATDVELRITEAEVDFLGVGEKGQVAMAAEVKISGFGLAATSEVETVTAIRYENGAFYLSDIRLDDLTLTPTLATRAKIAALKKAWKPIFDEFVAEVRASRGDESFEAMKADFQQNLVPLVRQAMDDALRNVPVYRLQGDPAKSAARLVLKDIAFTDGVAIAILSPAQAMIKIATGALTVLVVLLLAFDWFRETRRRVAVDRT